MIRVDHIPVLFGIEPGGEFCGIHQVTEEHGELASFRLWRSGGSSWRCRQRRGGGRVDRRLRVTRPNEDTPSFIHRQALAVEKLLLEDLQVRLIQMKLRLKGPIGQAA